MYNMGHVSVSSQEVQLCDVKLVYTHTIWHDVKHLHKLTVFMKEPHWWTCDFMASHVQQADVYMRCDFLAKQQDWSRKNLVQRNKHEAIWYK
jgi:hypothetical protein